MKYPLVKWFPLSRPALLAEIDKGVQDVLNSGILSWRNPVVRELEEKFAKYIGTKYAVSLSSGTAALHLAYKAVPAYRLVIPAFAYAAVEYARKYAEMEVSSYGPVDKGTWNIESSTAFPSNAMAVIVHTLGNPVEVALELKRAFIEDACEAIGGEWQGKKLGSIGAVGVFSFQGRKTISAGEGGMLVTDDPDIARVVAFLANQADYGDYCHGTLGYNYRMTALQAAVIIPQLEAIDEIVGGRQRALKWYRDRLPDNTQRTPEGGKHAAWLAGISGFREPMVAAAELARHDIEAKRVFSPIVSDPGADWLRATALMLPLWPDMEEEDVEFIVGKVRPLLA